MAFEYYMNMEKISLDIAKEHIENMTDDNMEDDIFLDEEKLKNNIKNGFVVITQLITFLESFLNTILNTCVEYKGKELLKSSIDEKLEIIFLYYKKDLSIVKSQHYWECFRRILKVRNEMIHYKISSIGMGTGIPDFLFAGIEAKSFFTRQYMQEATDKIIVLGDLIANELNLRIFHDINIFECDGRDGLVNYIYDEEKIMIDETRYEE